MNFDEYFTKMALECEESLLSAPLLNSIDTLTTNQLHYLFSQLYYFIEQFPGYLGALLLKSTDKSILFVVSQNLVDECGGIDKLDANIYTSSHSALLKDFITKSIGKPLAEMDIYTRILIESFRKLFTNSTLIESLSAMTIMESISNKWFSLVYDRLLKRNEFSELELYFFKIHISLDEVHGNALKNVLQSLITDYNSSILFRHGALSAMSYWDNFYTGLYGYLGGLSLDKVK
ncbi:MAG: iron-containing redox enzyme family protein [Gammaproteobacteria bacterium]|nr:iron-containing redox enzyme family protein [Gammaproteobacteria bacterium]